MSSFIFNCPHCQQAMTGDETIAGMEMQCPSCSGAIAVPAGPEPAATAPAVQPQTQQVTQDGGLCPYCQSSISAGDNVRTCPVCNTPHHSDCWNENKGCTVFGCTMGPPDEQKISVDEVNPASMAVAAQRHAAAHDRKNAPGAVSSLVYGILGFFICGVIFGCVAISKANEAKKAIEAQPDVYTGSGLATAGKVLGIVDLVAWGLIIVARATSGGS